MIDLSEAHLNQVKTILKAHVPELKVWVFGSRANAKAKKYSDLDLVLLGDAPIATKTLFSLRAACAESNLPFQVDVVDWHRIDEAFQKIIQQNYVVIQ